jgi:hypothetical protein
MVVQLAPAGLLFGADRNITTTVLLQSSATTTLVTGQSERPKVLKWPNHEVIVGYIGQARLAGKPTDQWLYSFIGRHLQFKNLQELADALTADLNGLVHTFPNESMVLHLGGFEMDNGQWRPKIYFIRNTTGLTPKGGYIMGTKFDCSEEISDPKYFGATPGNQIRAALAWPNYFSSCGHEAIAFGVQKDPSGVDRTLEDTLSTRLRRKRQRVVTAKLTAILSDTGNRWRTSADPGC